MIEEPFILKSEHKRVLASAQDRYDRELALRERLGFWRGVGQTVWISGFMALFGGLLAFNIGIWVIP
jgi:hypothetical protein